MNSKTRALLSTYAICFLASIAVAQSYTITDLHSFGGNNGSTATGLDDSGNVTGWSFK